MSIQSLREARTSKHFYRNGFRRTVWLLMISLIINGLLIWGIYTKLVNKIEPRYYSTSGVKAPIELQARSRPNDSTQYLLPPDPKTESDESLINQ